MKKALSVLLSMLMIFSMVGVIAFAEGEDTKVHYVFKVDGQEFNKFELTPDDKTTIAELIDTPSKAETETTRYLFKGWVLEGDETETIWHSGTIPAPKAEDVGKTFTYIAVFSETDLTERQTFWNLIESIFERINRLFEYFAEIFGF